MKKEIWARPGRFESRSWPLLICLLILPWSACNGPDSEKAAFAVSNSEMAISIGSEGGRVEVEDPRSRICGAGVDIPAEALEGETSLSIHHSLGAAELPPGIRRAGETVRFEPDGIRFGTPVEIQLPYADADNDGRIDGTNIHETSVRVVYFNEQSGLWQQIPDAEVDVERNVVRAVTEHFSEYSAVSYLEEVCAEDETRTCGPYYFTLYYNFRHDPYGYAASVSDAGIDLNVSNADLRNTGTAVLEYEGFQDLFNIVVDARRWIWSWQVLDSYTFFLSSSIGVSEAELVPRIEAAGPRELRFTWNFDYTQMAPSDMMVVKFSGISDTLCELLDRTPSIPENLRAGTVSDSSIQLIWDPVFYLYGEASYNIYMSADGGASYTLEAASTANSGILGGLTAQKEYFFKVTSVYNDTLESAESEVVQISTSAVPETENQAPSGS